MSATARARLAAALTRAFAAALAVLPAACGRADAPAATAEPCAPAAGAAAAPRPEAESDTIAALRGRAVRDTGGLHLLLANGTRATLADRTGDAASVDEFVSHRLVAWRPELGSYQVDVGYYEGRSTLLVDGTGGHRTLVWGRPLPAPGGGRFVAISRDLEAAYDPNGIQIWRRGADTLELEWQTEPTSWGPGDARWVDDTTLAVRAYPPVGAADSTVRCVLVRQDAEGWRIEGVTP